MMVFYLSNAKKSWLLLHIRRVLQYCCLHLHCQRKYLLKEIPA